VVVNPKGTKMRLEYVRPYPLGDEAFSFIRRELQHAELALCRHLLELPIEQGRTITYLPPDVELDRIRHFDLFFGAEFPPPDVYYDRYTPEVNAVLSRLAQTHLIGDAIHYVVGCDNMGNRTHESVAKVSHPMFFYGDEVYYFRHQQDGYKQPSSRHGLSFHVGFYPAVSLLTAIRAPYHSIGNRTDIGSQAMLDLATRTKYIVLDAYDATGYVYWCAEGEPYPHDVVNSY
jgi:hypothetical protein